MSSEGCPDPTVTPLTRVTYEPILSSFLKLCGGLMKLVIKFSDEESIEVLIKSIIDKSTTWQTIFELFKHNILIFLIFIAGIILAIVVLISCCLMILCRWFTSDQDKPKGSHIWCAWIMFLVCAAMSIVCIVLVSSGAHSITIGLEALPEQVNKSATAVASYIEQLERQFHCQFDREVNNISDYIEAVAKEFHQDIDDMGKAFKDFEKLQANLKTQDVRNKLAILINSGKANSDDITELMKLIQDVTEPSNAKIDKKQLQKGMSEFKKALDDFGSQRKAIQKVFGEMVDDTFSSVFDYIAQFVKRLSHAINAFLEKHDKFASHTNYIFLFCIAIPALLLTLCVISMVFLLLRALFNFCVKDPEGGKRGLLSRAGGEIMGTTGYVAMLTTALLFIMSSLAFLTAFGAMVVCVGFFEDRDLRVFRVTDYIFMPDNTLKIRVSDIFYKCKNNYSFFDALDGPRLLADAEMEDRIDRLMLRDAARDIERSVDDYESASIYETFLTTSAALFHKATVKPGVVQKYKDEAATSLKAFQGEVQKVMNIHKKILTIIQWYDSQQFKDKVSAINKKLVDTVEGLVAYTVDMSPRCGDIMSMWNEIGWYVCYLIGRPLSGIWIACLITAFASVIIYQSIFDATKYLKSMDASTMSVQSS